MGLDLDDLFPRDQPMNNHNNMDRRNMRYNPNNRRRLSEPFNRNRSGDRHRGHRHRQNDLPHLRLSKRSIFYY